VKSPDFNYASKKKCLCHAVDLGKLMESARNMYVILCRFISFIFTLQSQLKRADAGLSPSEIQEELWQH
jgi:hypothetical protein